MAEIDKETYDWYAGQALAGFTSEVRLGNCDDKALRNCAKQAHRLAQIMMELQPDFGLTNNMGEEDDL